MKNGISIFLILASVLIFFGYIKPGIAAIGVINKELNVYQDTLKQADELEQQIKKLRGDIDALNPEDMEKLKKLVPDNVDTISLIIDINNIAANFGLAISNISLGANKEDSSSTQTRSDSLYDSVDFSFKVKAVYPNFISFISALEKSLRLVDITSITFSPAENGTYDFSVNLRTYWIK